MWSIVIVLAFALMILTPCVIAFRGSRSRSSDEPYSSTILAKDSDVLTAGALGAESLEGHSLEAASLDGASVVTVEPAVAASEEHIVEAVPALAQDVVQPAVGAPMQSTAAPMSPAVAKAVAKAQALAAEKAQAQAAEKAQALAAEKAQAAAAKELQSLGLQMPAAFDKTVTHDAGTPRMWHENSLQDEVERTETEFLVAQAAAAHAAAQALAAHARAAQAKANAALAVATQATEAAQKALETAHQNRKVTTENDQPQPNGSLDFAKAKAPRRAA